MNSNAKLKIIFFFLDVYTNFFIKLFVKFFNEISAKLMAIKLVKTIGLLINNKKCGTVFYFDTASRPKISIEERDGFNGIKFSDFELRSSEWRLVDTKLK